MEGGLAACVSETADTDAPCLPDETEPCNKGRGKPKTLFVWKCFKDGGKLQSQKRCRAICNASLLANPGIELKADPEEELKNTSALGKKYAMEKHVFQCKNVPVADKKELQRYLETEAMMEGPEEAELSPKRAKPDGLQVIMKPCFQKWSPALRQKFESLMIQFFVTQAIPFSAVESMCFRDMLRCLQGNVQIPGREKLATTLLQAEKIRATEKARQRTQQERNLTVCFDSWTEQFGRASVFGVNVVVPSDKSVYLLGAIDIPDVRHTTDNSLPKLLECLELLTPGQVAAVCSDNAANLRLLRQKLTDLPAYKHILSVRCQMHAFSLVVKSALAHEWAASVVKRASSIVCFFRESTYYNSRLMTIANARSARPVAGLASAGSTRMTSVSTMLESLRRLRVAFDTFIATGADDPEMRIVARYSKRAKLVKDVLENHRDKFFTELGQLADLLLPFSKVVMAIQGSWSTLADVTRYWLYLAQALKDILPRLPRGYAKHVATVYNRRAMHLDSNLGRLALLLHPAFREKAVPSALLREVVTDAMEIMSFRTTDPNGTDMVASKIRQYIDRERPYSTDFVGDSWDVVALKRWWRRTGDPRECVLVQLAYLMMDITCTSASTERMFSIMGWLKPKTRNRMSVATLEAITAIKLAHQGDVNPHARQATTKAPREVQSMETHVDMPCDGSDGDEDLDIALAVESLVAQEVEEATHEQMLEATRGMSFVELLTGNWDGFDMDMEGYEPGTHPPWAQGAQEAVTTGPSQFSRAGVQDMLSGMFP